MKGDVIVDVIHLGHYRGISLTMMGCLPFGRLVLFNHKRDFRERSGGTSPNQIMNRDADHVNALVYKYLGYFTGALIFCHVPG
jgi:hypothetical protein